MTTTTRTFSLSKTPLYQNWFYPDIYILYNYKWSKNINSCLFWSNCSFHILWRDTWIIISIPLQCVCMAKEKLSRRFESGFASTPKPKPRRQVLGSKKKCSKKIFLLVDFYRLKQTSSNSLLIICSRFFYINILKKPTKKKVWQNLENEKKKKRNIKMQIFS